MAIVKRSKSNCDFPSGWNSNPLHPLSPMNRQDERTAALGHALDNGYFPNVDDKAMAVEFDRHRTAEDINADREETKRIQSGDMVTRERIAADRDIEVVETAVSGTREVAKLITDKDIAFGQMHLQSQRIQAEVAHKAIAAHERIAKVNADRDAFGELVRGAVSIASRNTSCSNVELRDSKGRSVRGTWK